MSTGFVYDDIYLRHEMPRFHPESVRRLESIMNRLRRSDVWPRLIQLEPKPATDDDLARVHQPGYIRRVHTVGTGYLDPDTYMSPDTDRAAQFAAGAIIRAVDACRGGEIRRAFCAVRPPGHHAEADRGMGFCLFNNVAVGARYAQSIGYSRVMIIDFDVHHGNGTQHTFYDDDTVFFVSSHQYPFYPGTGSEGERGAGRGEGFTHNFPLPAGSGDREFKTIYGDSLPGLMRSFNPDLVMVSAGYDAHGDDPLGGLCVSDNGFRRAVRSILDSAGKIPVIMTLEGGYNLEALARCVELTLVEMVDKDQTGQLQPFLV